MYTAECKISQNYYGCPQFNSHFYGINVTFVADLIPARSQKSFYGRAKVLQSEDGNIYLQSYATIVCYVDAEKKLHRLWDGESRTTMKHVDSFVREFLGYKNGMGVSEWRKLPVEK